MNFNFKKKYGQNFLKHDNVSSRIVSLIDTNKDTLVIEIGPGSGALTKHLSNLECNTICYEIDRELESPLSKYKSDKLDIIFDDFMKRDIISDISKYNYKKLVILGNLPYYITTPIILKIIETIIPEEMVFMVQKEVAERFSAKNKSKDYRCCNIIKDSFMFKRKNLRNNLKNYNKEEIEKVLAKYNFDLNNRAEDLPLEVFIELSKLI